MPWLNIKVSTLTNNWSVSRQISTKNIGQVKAKAIGIQDLVALIATVVRGFAGKFVALVVQEVLNFVAAYVSPLYSDEKNEFAFETEKAWVIWFCMRFLWCVEYYGLENDVWIVYWVYYKR